MTAPETREMDQHYRSARVRARFALIVLVIHMFVIVMVSLATTAEVSFLYRAEEGQVISAEEIIRQQISYRRVIVLSRVTAVATAIVFLMWMHRASSNLVSLGSHGQRYSPRAGIIWWFVPIAWFFIPFQVTKEIWKGSVPRQSVDDCEAWQNTATPMLMVFWWGIWLLDWLCSLTLAILPLSGLVTSTDDYIRHGWLSFFSGLIIIAAGVLLFKIVRRITKNQEVSRAGG